MRNDQPLNPRVHENEPGSSESIRRYRGACLFSIVSIRNARGGPNAFLSRLFRDSQTGRPVNKAFWRRPKMKSIANRLFLFAAAALSLGTVAYGQTTVKADVPFAFRTPGGAS